MFKKIKDIKFEFMVILFFVAIRIPSLGRDVFNTDVWKWKQRTYDFGSGVFEMDFKKTIQKYHPGVTLMWIGSVGVKVNNIFVDYLPTHYEDGSSVDGLLASKIAYYKTEIGQVFLLHFVQKLFLVTVIGISLAFAIYPLRKLFGSEYAFILFLLLMVEPFYLALTRVFHLEGLMSTFMFASVSWFYYFLHEKKFTGLQPKNNVKKLYVSSFFGALAVLTKSTALYLLPFTGLAMFLFYFLKNKKTDDLAKKTIITLKKFCGDYFKWLVGFFLVIVILWPALWVDPAGAIKTVFRGIFVVGIEKDHIQYFFGKLVEDPGLFYYPVVFLLKSSIYLLGGLAGWYLLKMSKIKIAADEDIAQNDNRKNFVLYILLYSVFYVALLTIPSKKLDRYILPSIVGLAPVAAFFFEKAINYFDAPKKIIYTLLILPMVLYLGALHPDYLSYYNPVFGGLKTGINIIEPKWMIGTKEIMQYFKQKQQTLNYSTSFSGSFEEMVSTGKTEEVLTVGFQEKYYTQIWPFFRDFGAWAVVKDLTPFAKETRYFVYPVWDDDSNLEDRFELKYLEDIYVQGVPLYRVYERT